MSEVATEQDVIAAALTLDADGRSRVAELLWASLDAADGFDLPPSPAWITEIERRVAEIDGGTARLLPADEVFRHLRGGRGQ